MIKKRLDQLANWLPSIMIHMEGFMEELEREDYDGSVDSLNDVDWEEVATNYEEDIDTILKTMLRKDYNELGKHSKKSRGLAYKNI